MSLVKFKFLSISRLMFLIVIIAPYLMAPSLLAATEVKQSKIKLNGLPSHQSKIELLVNKVSWVKIREGKFLMGCDLTTRSTNDSIEGGSCEEDELPQHKVNISTFSIMQTEVTFELWDACYESGGCTHKPDDHGFGRGLKPVFDVSYKDIVDEFIPWFNKKTELNSRLPSEAEWEYVATLGFSNEVKLPDCDQAQYGRRGNGECSKSRDGPVNVGSFSPLVHEKFVGKGIFDLQGNVWEWVEDCYQPTYENAPSDGTVLDSINCEQRVLKGGSWYSRVTNLRPAERFNENQQKRSWFYGFRLVYNH